MKSFYDAIIDYPKWVLAAVLLITAVMLSQFSKLYWETDARVYMPKGHEAIKYDEEIERIFGVKDSIIIIIKNENGIYNPETLERIKRITKKVAEIEGVVANRVLDIASLSTASVFVGTEEEMGARPVMRPTAVDDSVIAEMRQRVADYDEILVGNLVSEDEKVAVIRVKVKEGANNRYMAYWQIKGILDAESGEQSTWEGDWQGEWQKENWGTAGADGEATTESEAETKADDAAASAQGGWSQEEMEGWWKGSTESAGIENGDTFYLAGRPAIEVTSGLNALDDVKSMVPVLVLVFVLVLFYIFKTWRGVLLPLTVVTFAIIWTVGAMAMANVPMYTISTMLPVILVAVGIADSVHFLSRYNNKVLERPHAPSAELVRETLYELGPPLLTTSLTTGVGFVALVFAEMPPFKIFGIVTLIGVMLSWLLTITYAAATLVLLKPKVGGYLDKRRSLRVHEDQDGISIALVRGANALLARKGVWLALFAVLAFISAFGAMKLAVNSSWLSDFREDSDVVQAAHVLNERMDGSVMLNVVLDAGVKDGLKSPEVLAAFDRLQDYAETLPYVGDSLSIIDYLKSMNESLNNSDPAYYVLPDSREAVSEYLYLYSISGQPELLDEVVDYDYQKANLMVIVTSDQTAYLKNVIDSLREYADGELEQMGVDVNFAGQANNSYIWADLLIDSQAVAILFSKVAIFLMALIMFRSVAAAVMIVVPVAMTTLVVAGMSGWLGIPLDVSTALAAGLAIGVGVDYAIHYTFFYRARLKAGDGQERAVVESMRSVGRVIVLNAFIVIAGFSVLMISKFPPHEKLGVFVMVYMVLSCLFALMLLPLIKLRAVGESGGR